jgi:DnaJ-class molecular chaperone
MKTQWIITRTDLCHRCGGTGQGRRTSVCTSCAGRKTITREVDAKALIEDAVYGAEMQLRILAEGSERWHEVRKRLATYQEENR